jgi:hypothetical protein
MVTRHCGAWKGFFCPRGSEDAWSGYRGMARDVLSHSALCLASGYDARSATQISFRDDSVPGNVNTRRPRGELARGRYGATAVGVAGIWSAERTRMKTESDTLVAVTRRYAPEFGVRRYHRATTWASRHSRNPAPTTRRLMAYGPRARGRGGTAG